jgi:hypothetical protein
MLEQTFETFRACGAFRHECKAYWVSPWSDPQNLTQVVHPKHRSSMYGLSIDDRWIGEFWTELVDQGLGVRVQIHTHPFEAFHSKTDDDYPLLFDVGYLSLVIPNFAKGPIGFEGAYLAEIQSDGAWKQVAINSRIIIDDEG